MAVTIDGRRMTGQKVVRAARPGPAGRWEKAVLAPAARERIGEARAYIERNWLTDDAPLMYAFNTGVGLFKDVRIPIADMARYQDQTIRAHATGIGEPLPRDAVRATMLLRANAFASAYSGATLGLIDRLTGFLNAGLHPVIPAKGSVGASGDLAPLAYLAGAIRGFEDVAVEYKGRIYPAPEAARRAGLAPDYPMGAKEASAIINGSTVSLAIATLAAEDAGRIRKHADVALCLSLEALRGELAAFDQRVHAARPHPGQARVARNVLRIAGESRRCSEAARAVLYPDETRDPAKPIPLRVQDVYSLRCAPQVHGPVADALDYIDGILTTEMNSATDNPLMFADGDDRFVSISGGHFHGAYVAQAMDLLAIAMADLGAISERRLARLIDPAMSYGLPRNLVAGQRGLNTGYATVQCSMSALVMENRSLATPGSVDSIPGKGNAEDHVSNSTWCARKARTIVENVEQIVAVEMLLAAQALSLVAERSKDHPIGRGSRAALEAIRARIEPALAGDRWYHHELAAILDLARSGTIVAAVEEAVGALE
ncbi:HAL/PAL/TAL family ammonia-lyase [Labrys wisconsinensis]|uniref:Histidine ammonia-lyase n=1 Tax=Labrys wisconsinensis TaxID=425677 RepID=A0ABU0J3S6_9HYPH|nr:aromatic amino acid ammonia-lyase [Labrys wisconsinensis]MDQ0468924.1 histidine ammonia-lyase [Labrys wisconsinensis]